MPDLRFEIEGAEPVPFSMAPLLHFKLRVAENCSPGAAATPIHAIALRCQIRIEPTRRRYVAGEPDKLRDLFGESSRWGQTLKSMLWAHANVVVPPFTDTARVDLPVPCSFDFNVAATKYFDALEGGDVPLLLLFSGTIFYEAADAILQVAQIPWEREADFRLPIRVWKDMMEHYYPNTAWLCLRRDAFDDLSRYKSQRGMTSWEQALETLLAPHGARVLP